MIIISTPHGIFFFCKMFKNYNNKKKPFYRLGTYSFNIVRGKKIRLILCETQKKYE